MAFSEERLDLQCSICLERFYDPIILNCGHTFDRLCIEKMIQLNQSLIPIRTIKCPLCNCLFDPGKPLISNKSLIDVIQYEPTFEWFVIDISTPQQKTNVLTFLKRVFKQRSILEINHITFETDEGRITFHPNTNFDEQLPIKSLSNLEKTLQEICGYLTEQDGLRKMCILTDGLTKHSHVTKIDSKIIHQRFLIHIGDQNIHRTRELADRINFHFGYFNEKTLEIYVQDFLTNF